MMMKYCYDSVVRRKASAVSGEQCVREGRSRQLTVSPVSLSQLRSGLPSSEVSPVNKVILENFTLKTCLNLTGWLAIWAPGRRYEARPL